MLNLLRSHANAGISNFDDRPAIVSLDSNRKRPAFGHGMVGILEKVKQDHPHFGIVGKHSQLCFGQFVVLNNPSSLGIEFQ